MNQQGTKQLETQHLYLRKFVEDDSEQLYFNVMSDKNVFKYFAFSIHKGISETRQCIENWIQEYKKENTYIWAIVEKESNQVIGNINLDSLYLPLLQVGELAYFIGTKWWGKGYATEAVSEVIKYLFSSEKVFLIEAKHSSQNMASGRVLIKAGMKKEAVLKNRRIDKETGERFDLIIYSVQNGKINIV